MSGALEDEVRAKDAGLGPASDTVEIEFEGRRILGRRGETLAATLTAAGELALRTTASGAARGLFCGMGVCQECLVEVDGGPARRACMTKLTRPLSVRRHAPRAAVGAGGSAEPGRAPPPLAVEVLVIGGGAGGLSAAAAAAEAGAEVLLVDERPDLGGQFFKQPLAAPDLPDARFDDRQFARGRRLIERARASGATVLRGAEVVGVFEPRDVVVAHEGHLRVLRPGCLIVAAGAHERPIHVPGWTLPGVMTTGAAQTLLRSYRVLPGRRVLVAGNGPLNLQVALELARAGAEIAAVVELAPAPGPCGLGALGTMLAADPALALQGGGYLAGLAHRRIPVLHGRTLAQVERAPDGLAARIVPWPLRDGAMPGTFAVDAVAMSYGFAPSNELLRALGCRMTFDERRGHLVTARDASCATSVEHVYAVGDCAGLNGAQAAQADGIIAGLAAARRLGRQISPEAAAEERRARATHARQARFQDALWRLFAACPPELALAGPETILCRCEEVTVGEVRAAAAGARRAIGAVKRTTRAGMGPCQGRFCGPALAQLLAETGGTALDEDAYWAPRPPVKPVALGALADLELEPPDERGAA